MPMTWDNQSQAFVEAETPTTYNPQLEAWEDSDGHEYNHGLEAWEKVWPDQPKVPIDGLVAEYTMDNISGTTLYDTSGNDTNITLVGAEQTSDGVVGDGLLITSYGNVIDQFSNHINPYTTNPIYRNGFNDGLSISFFIKYNVVIRNNYHTILSFSRAGYDSQTWNGSYSTSIWFNKENDVEVLNFHQNVEAIEGLRNTVLRDFLCNANTFTHYVFTYTASTNKTRIYENGVMRVENTVVNDVAIHLNNLTNYNMVLGSVAIQYQPIESGMRGGILDQLRFYNRPLTAHEVSQLYNRGKGI